MAVSHASWLASAGSRLDPERKNRRVKVMKVKVCATAQTVANAVAMCRDNVLSVKGVCRVPMRW